MLESPTAYAEGYAKAQLLDQALADNYIRHTTIGDPELDPVMEELSSMNPGHLHRFIGAGIEQHNDILRDAPKSLRDFFANLQDPPGSTTKRFVRAFAPSTPTWTSCSWHSSPACWWKASAR